MEKEAEKGEERGEKMAEGSGKNIIRVPRKNTEDKDVATFLNQPSATPPRGSYMAQSQVLKQVKVFDKNYLLPTDTVTRHLDGTESLERSPRLSLDDGDRRPILFAQRANALAESVKGIGDLPFDDNERRRSDTPGGLLAKGEILRGGLVPHSLPTSPAKNMVQLRKEKEDKERRRNVREETTEGAETGGRRRGTTGSEVQAHDKGEEKGEKQSNGSSSSSRVLNKWRRKLPLLKALKDEEVCQVGPGLYVGGVGGAKNRERLLACGITHVVNASPVIPCFYEQDFEYLLLEGFYDQSSENIDEMIEMSNAFIHRALGDPNDPTQHTIGNIPASSEISNDAAAPTSSSPGPGGVYVHCYAGVSRSATLVIAYLMCHRGLSLIEAMRRVRRARPVICPNTGFMEQLAVYEDRLKMECQIAQKLRDQIQDTLLMNRDINSSKAHAAASVEPMTPPRKDHHKKQTVHGGDNDDTHCPSAAAQEDPHDTAEVEDPFSVNNTQTQTTSLSLDAFGGKGCNTLEQMETPVLLAKTKAKTADLHMKEEVVEDEFGMFDMDLNEICLSHDRHLNKEEEQLETHNNVDKGVVLNSVGPDYIQRLKLNNSGRYNNNKQQEQQAPDCPPVDQSEMSPPCVIERTQ
jgi:hypothetical protein